MSLEKLPKEICQRGGTYERLLYVLDQSQSEYMIHIDADTLVTNDEVVGCVENDVPFTKSDGFRA